MKHALQHRSPAPPLLPVSAVPHPLAAGFLLAAVGLAFADASVVALALPDLYTEFQASIPAVSGVLISYALALALAGFLGVLLLRRVSAAMVTATGAIVFAAASVASGAAPSLPFLIAARAIQGIGGAALVGGAFAALVPLAGSPRRAARWWAVAGTAGAAVGPALGGLVTQLLDWRAVFFVQAPVALAALVGCLVVARSAGSAAGRVEVDRRRRPAGALIADSALALTFGALVGALFLGVLLLVVVWGLPPLAGAVAVSTLPLGTLVAPRLARSLGARGEVIAGAALLAGGLATLALLPAISTVWVSVALGLCGLGFGLLVGVLGPFAVPAGSGLRAATLSSAVRHIGLVLGLAVIAPVLAADMTAAAERAPLPAAASMLDAPLDGVTKVRLALDIRDELESVPQGEVPDLSSVFARYQTSGADDADNEAIARLQSDIERSVEGVITRAFRASLTVAALMAVMAGVVAFGAVVMVERRRRLLVDDRRDGASQLAGTRRLLRARRAVVVAAVAAAVALPLGAVSAGAAEFGVVRLGDPCSAAPDPFPGKGFDAIAQRFVLSGLNGAACELGVSREELVLSLDPRAGIDEVRWDRPTIEEALRSGVKRGIADADERDAIPGWLATVLRLTVDRAPISWFLDRLGVS